MPPQRDESLTDRRSRVMRREVRGLLVLYLAFAALAAFIARGG